MTLLMRFSKRICCLSIIHVLLFSIEFSCGNVLSSVCCTECNCNVTENGECSLQYRGDCSNETCIYFNFPNETSIIEVNISTQYQQVIGYYTESTSSVEAVRLDIYEFNTDTKQYSRLETRNLLINESNPQIENYLTRSSKARICVSLVANWSSYEVKFSFKERKYTTIKLEVENPSSESGEILGNYVPNSVSLYKLPKHPTRNWKGIEIEIQDLKIDSEKGEYILIGAGSADDYPPRFMSSITESSSFFIANASAYIEFVSRSFRNTSDSFKIIWKRIDAEMPVPIKPEDALNAILVCFHNYTEAKKEFVEKNKDKAFSTFREAFAESVRNNTKDEFPCTKSSVRFIGYPREFTTSGALSILVTLQCEEKLFKYQELQNLMAIFTEEDLNKTLGYKVELCESLSNHMSSVGMWTIFIYVSVASLGLLIWAWKNNIFSQKCIPEKENPTFDLEINSFPAEENTYEMTIPKVCLEDGYGRRQTLVPGSPEEEEQVVVENVTEVEMNAIPSTSQESDKLLQVLANRRGKRRPNIQSLISKEDENASNTNCNVPKSEGDESEHLYDSVSSSKEMKETKL